MAADKQQLMEKLKTMILLRARLQKKHPADVIAEIAMNLDELKERKSQAAESKK
jgi:hypothetical protein